MAIKITTEIDTDIPLPLSHGQYIDIISSVISMNAVIMISEVRFKRSQGPPDSHHEYVITAADGRQWFQDVQTIDASVSYLMTFNIPDQWDLREIVAQRAIRDNLVTLDREFGISQFVITIS